MRYHAKQETEPIVVALEGYRAELLEHPLLVAARTGPLERRLLNEFACYQYADSITWIPMLAQMKSLAARSRRLRKAIEDNIAHEAGLGGTSHVVLAARLVRSLGVRGAGAIPIAALARETAHWLDDEFAEMSEPALAGWLLVAETLVPVMFAEMLPHYRAVAGADITYFSEHVVVDSDEHSAWMLESVGEVLAIYGPPATEAVLAGMRAAWVDTREDPDALLQLRER